MALIYAMLIMKGQKRLPDVPAAIREAVRTALIDLDCPELAE